MKIIRILVFTSIVSALVGCASDKGTSGSGTGGYYENPSSSVGTRDTTGGTNTGGTPGNNYNSPGIPYNAQ